MTLTELAICCYVNEPCRICGRMLSRADVETAVFAGYSADNKSRAAHGACWKPVAEAAADLLHVLRAIVAEEDRLISTGDVITNLSELIDAARPALKRAEGKS